MAKRPPSKPVPVKDVLNALISPAEMAALKQRSLIRQVWEASLPSSLKAQTRLVDFRRKELVVEVSASPWVQELQFLKPRLLQALEKTLGPGVIRDLKFRVGEGTFGGGD